MRRIVILYPLLFLALFDLSAQQAKVTIDGSIRDIEKEPLSFATIVVKELNLGMMANTDGYFKFTATEGESYTLVFSYLNHVTETLVVTAHKDQHLDIVLERLSYALEEVVVMAEYKNHQGSTAIINQQALEHIQPTSVSDVMILTPGGLHRDTKITGFNRISIRQSGADNNTSLGMAVVMDGVPQDNDGFRSQIPGLESVDNYANRLSLNKGIDLKTISTDHIQKIEIVKGISSAKLGNLSSGVIQTVSKIGQTPLQVRVKTDPLTKLAYAGKGLRLSPALGFMHIGVDYTSVYDDRRDPLSKYNRLTGQITYNNSFDVGDHSLFLFLKLSEVYTLNQAKEDELTQEYNELFSNKFSRSGAVLKARLSPADGPVNSIEFISSLDYTYDLMERNHLVQLGAPLPSPLSSAEGEREGIFLPSQYYSFYQIENKPLALLNQINMETLFQTKSFNHKLIYGAEWKNTKNHGRGVLIDMTRPPYPGDSKYVRPVPNNSIPALSVGAAYLEDQISHTNDYFDFSLYAGVRATKMFNLDAGYRYLRKLMLEPRVNAAVSLNIPTGDTYLKNMFRVGFGQESKLPTLDFLYPDHIYKDLIVLSAYVKHEDPNNHLITDTRIYDVTNKLLKPNRNNKFEVGWDMEWKDYLLSLTLFSEHSDRGYQRSVQYNPVSYLRYIEPANGQPIIGKKPQKGDYVEERYETFLDMPIVRNSVKTEKKGLEYRIRFPKITALATNVEINGAYYETRYAGSVPVQYHPIFKDENKPMPYVGIYEKGDMNRQRILNSNIWINTNIPKYKMIFTTLCQVIWLNDAKRINGDSYPVSYMALDGRTYLVDEAILQKIKEEELTWRHYHLYKESYYEEEPVSLMVNFKMTKEFSRMIKASFFVNGIVDINPKYKNRYEQNARNWKKSFFGAELTFSL